MDVGSIAAWGATHFGASGRPTSWYRGQLSRLHLTALCASLLGWRDMTWSVEGASRRLKLGLLDVCFPFYSHAFQGTRTVAKSVLWYARPAGQPRLSPVMAAIDSPLESACSQKQRATSNPAQPLLLFRLIASHRDASTQYVLWLTRLFSDRPRSTRHSCS